MGGVSAPAPAERRRRRGREQYISVASSNPRCDFSFSFSFAFFLLGFLVWFFFIEHSSNQSKRLLNFFISIGVAEVA